MIGEEALTREVIGAAIEVHREMGPGLLESVYQSCLESELLSRSVEFKARHRILLHYKGKPLKDELVIDFFFSGSLVLEIKAVEKIIPVHEAQLLTYLRLTKVKVGLLLNFNSPVLRME